MIYDQLSIYELKRHLKFQTNALAKQPFCMQQNFPSKSLHLTQEWARVDSNLIANGRHIPEPLPELLAILLEARRSEIAATSPKHTSMSFFPFPLMLPPLIITFALSYLSSQMFKNYRGPSTAFFQGPCLASTRHYERYEDVDPSAHDVLHSSSIRNVPRM